MVCSTVVLNSYGFIFTESDKVKIGKLKLVAPHIAYFSDHFGAFLAYIDNGFCSKNRACCFYVSKRLGRIEGSISCSSKGTVRVPVLNHSLCLI